MSTAPSAWATFTEGSCSLALPCPNASVALSSTISKIPVRPRVMTRPLVSWAGPVSGFPIGLATVSSVIPQDPSTRDQYFVAPGCLGRAEACGLSGLTGPVRASVGVEVTLIVHPVVEHANDEDA